MFNLLQIYLGLWYEFLLFLLFYHLLEMKIAYFELYVFPSSLRLPTPPPTTTPCLSCLVFSALVAYLVFCCWFQGGA